MNSYFVKWLKRSLTFCALAMIVFGTATPSVLAVNVVFECWCRDETTRICDHFRIDSGIDATESVWTGGRYSVIRPDGHIYYSASVKTVVDAVDLSLARKEELKGLCQVRCAADGGKTSIHYETTYREEVCSECTAASNSSCTEESDARLSAGTARQEELIAQCEDRQPQSLLPVHLAVPIGGINQVNGLPDYINIAYRYLVTVVLVVAIVMVVYGGFRYLVGASLGDIQAGKKIIIDAIVGMLIVLGAYTILSTINPNTTILSLAPPTPIACRNLDLPDAVKNARCTSDSSCPSGQRCVEARDYLYSQQNVARAQQEGMETGADIGRQAAEDAGLVGDGVSVGSAAFWGGPFGLVGALVGFDNILAAEGAVAGSLLGNAAGTIVEVRRASDNIRVCSTLEQGSPCLEDRSCSAGSCIRSWSICWADSGNEPGQPCDSDEQCSNGSCVAVVPEGWTSIAPGDPNPAYPYKVCEIEVENGTPCFRPDHGNSQTVFPIQCNGAPLGTEFICAWCPPPGTDAARVWSYLNPATPYPGQCKPLEALGTDCTQ